MELRQTLFRIYRDQHVYLALVLTFTGGTLVPLILLLAGGGAPSSLGAVTLIVLGSLAVRVLFIKIPHGSHESRSASEA